MIGGTSTLSIIITAIDKASGTLNKMGNKFTQTGAKMQSIGKSMSMSLTLPIAALGIASTKMGLDFSKGIEYANTMLKLSDEEMEKFKVGVLAMSDTYGKSAADIARSAYSVSSVLHTSGEDTIKILDSIAKGAKAGKITTEEAGNAVVRMMSIYGTSAEDTMKVVDTLSATVKAGNANWQDMAQILPSVASLGKPLGVSMNEVAGAFAVASSKVGSTAEAGTAIRGIFNALMKPSDDLKDAIREMGNEMGYGSKMTAQMMIEEIGLEGVLASLGKEYGNSAEKIGELFPNIRAITGATAMFANEGKDLSEAMGMVADSVGETNAQIEAGQGTAENFADAINKLKNAGIRLFTIIEPYLSKFIAYISKLATKFSNLSPETKKIIVIIAAVVAALGPLLMIIGTLIISIAAIGVALAAVTVPALVMAATIAAITAAIILTIVFWVKLYKKIKEFKDIAGSWSNAWKLALLNAKINWGKFLVSLLQGVAKMTRLLPKLNLAVSESMAEVARSVGNAAREFEIVATEVKNTTEDVEDLEGSNEKLKNSISELDNLLGESTNSLDGFGEAAEDAAEKAEKAFDGAVDVIKNLRVEMKNLEESMTESTEDYSKKKLEINADYEDQIVKKIADAEEEIIDLSNKVVQARADGNIKEANDLSAQLDSKRKMVEKFHENYKDLEDNLAEQKEFLRMNDMQQIEYNKEKELLLAQKAYLEKQVIFIQEAIEKRKQQQLAIKMIGEEKEAAINAAIEKTKTFKEKLLEKMEAFDKWKDDSISGWQNWLSQVNSIISSVRSAPTGGGSSPIIARTSVVDTMLNAGFQHYQEGGVVPGLGAQLAVVHGGETIIPKGKVTKALPQVVVNITGNSFMSDEDSAEKIGDMIIERLKTQMRFIY